ncbi:MAG: hypothetical protein EBR82_38465 [Caulobacteraceae bacterium]|nr:hypothetical protein [Caulobacteraceae bacterium]
MASIEREVENALISAINSVTGLSYYTSERETARTLPFVSARASIGNEQLGTFTGVFGVSAVLSYNQRADSVTRQAFDSKFQEIVGKFYQNPNLAVVSTTASNVTIYNAKMTGESPFIVAGNRTWSKEITFDIIVSAKK